MPVPLRFQFEEFGREVDLLHRLSRQFLAPSAEWIFPRLIEVLRQVRTGGGRDEVRWEVSEREPLRTVETNRYEPGTRRGGLDVFGEVSWCWGIRPVPCKRKRLRRTGYRITGQGITLSPESNFYSNASTRRTVASVGR